MMEEVFLQEKHWYTPQRIWVDEIEPQHRAGVQRDAQGINNYNRYHWWISVGITENGTSGPITKRERRGVNCRILYNIGSRLILCKIKSYFLNCFRTTACKHGTAVSEVRECKWESDNQKFQFITQQSIFLYCILSVLFITTIVKHLRYCVEVLVWTS